MQLLRWPLPSSRRVARPIVRAAAVLLASLAVLSGPAVIGPAMAEPAAGNEETSATPAADAKKNMRVIYLGKEYPEPLPLSYSEKLITDKGIQGARLMLKEANQAGNFIGYSFEGFSCFCSSFFSFLRCAILATGPIRFTIVTPLMWSF